MALMIQGIYSLELLTQTQSLASVKHFVFDLRPRSFNFIQEYKIHEILQTTYQSEATYHFLFQNEKDFVILEFLKKLEQSFEKISGTSPMNSVFLQLMGTSDFHAFDQFSHAYYWHWDGSTDLKGTLESKYLKGLYFSYEKFEELMLRGELFDFIEHLKHDLLPTWRERKMKLVLGLKWESDVMSFLLDQIPFNFWQLAIDSHVELSYRRPDFPKLGEMLRYYKDQIDEYFVK